MGAIGDVVNALTLATALKRGPEPPEVGWAVHQLSQPMVEGHPHVDRVHLWRKGDGLGGFRRVVREVRAQRYDLAIDLQRIAKSGLLARLSGAPRVLGFDRARTKEGAWLLANERIPAGDRGAPMAEQYAEFARYLGLGDGAPERVLPADDEAEREAGALVEELGGAPLLINLAASRPSKQWPAERFGELATRLAAETGLPLCLNGAPADRPLADAALDAGARAAGARDMVGRTSLLELLALQRRARLFVGCDTGPMHMAAAVGLPVVALFGSGDPRRTGPWGDGHQVVRVPPPCAPCNKATCRMPRHDCMLDIDVELVVRAVLDTLAREPEGVR
jgi:lipopolysaccharide heptosyltransferase II